MMRKVSAAWGSKVLHNNGLWFWVPACAGTTWRERWRCIAPGTRNGSLLPALAGRPAEQAFEQVGLRRFAFECEFGPRRLVLLFRRPLAPDDDHRFCLALALGGALLALDPALLRPARLALGGAM